MKMYGKASEITQRIVEAFKGPETLPAALALYSFTERMPYLVVSGSGTINCWSSSLKALMLEVCD